MDGDTPEEADDFAVIHPADANCFRQATHCTRTAAHCRRIALIDGVFAARLPISSPIPLIGASSSRFRVPDAGQRERTQTSVRSLRKLDCCASGASLIYRVACQAIDPAAIVRQRARPSRPRRAACGGGLRPALTAGARCRNRPPLIDGSSCPTGGRPRASRMAALSRTRSLRITATMMTLPGLPRARRRWQKAMISGSHRIAVRAGLNRITFTAARPGARPRRSCVRPLWCTRGAKPPSAAISRRSSLPSSGNSASSAARSPAPRPCARTAPLP